MVFYFLIKVSFILRLSSEGGFRESSSYVFMVKSRALPLNNMSMINTRFAILTHLYQGHGITKNRMCYYNTLNDYAA